MIYIYGIICGTYNLMLWWSWFTMWGHPIRYWKKSPFDFRTCNMAVLILYINVYHVCYQLRTIKYIDWLIDWLLIQSASLDESIRGIRLWEQHLRVLSTVQSCHNSLVHLDTLLDICPLILHHCVVTGLHSSSTLRSCAQSLLFLCKLPRALIYSWNVLRMLG